MAENDFEMFLSNETDDGGNASEFLRHLLNRGLQLIPDILQTGIKNKQTLRAHLQNVACFSFQLAHIVGLSDEETLQTLAAAAVHDLNKFPEFRNKSYDSIANTENVKNIIAQMLLDRVDDFDIDSERVAALIRAHSAHLHVDGEGLMAARKDARRDKMIAVLRTSDTFDLSKDFYEREQKEKALRFLNGALDDRQYEYAWHYFSDNRGLYTNFVHNSIATALKKQGCIPLLHYPEGIWYLKPKGKCATLTPQVAYREMKKQFVNLSSLDMSKLITPSKVGFRFSQNPVSLGHPPSIVVDLIIQQISKRPAKWYQNKYEDIRVKVGPQCRAAYLKWKRKSEKRQATYEKALVKHQKLLSKVGISLELEDSVVDLERLTDKQKEQISKSQQNLDEALRLIELDRYFNKQKIWKVEPADLISPNMEALQCGEMVASAAQYLTEQLEIPSFDSESAWRWAARESGLPFEENPEIIFFNRQSTRGYRIGTLLHQKGIGLPLAANRLKEGLQTLLQVTNIQNSPGNDDAEPELIEYIRDRLRTESTPLGTSKAALKDYAEFNHQQCCNCSSALGHTWAAGHTPKNVKVQIFSNRLKAADRSNEGVVRNVCEVCRQSFLLERILHETYSRHHYYLHLYADGGEYSSHAAPAIFLDFLKNGIQSMLDLDYHGFILETDAYIKEYLAQIHPKFAFTPDTSRNGLLLPSYPWNIAGQMTFGFNPQGKKENETTSFVKALGYLLIITRAWNLRGALTKSPMPPFKVDEFGKLYIDHVPVALKALIPENEIDAEKAETLWQCYAGLYGLKNIYNPLETEELAKIARTLYDRTGLETIHYLKNRFASSRMTREQRNRPWERAWPFLQTFIQEEHLMPIKKLAQIAYENHFHGKTWNDTSQAKPLDLAFDSLEKFNPKYETYEDLKMIILHNVTRGLERVLPYILSKEKRAGIAEFVDVFYEDLFKGKYQGNKTKIEANRNRIRSAFLAYRTVFQR